MTEKFNLYYDCPLKAAYMAKYHGVRFLDSPYPITYSFKHNDISGQIVKYIVHPDDCAWIIQFFESRAVRYLEAEYVFKPLREEINVSEKTS